MYVKLPKGGAKWTVLEVSSVELDGVFYQLPGLVAGDFDWRSFLETREIRIREHVHVEAPYAGAGVTGSLHEDCVRVVHLVEIDGTETTHVFQGEGYVLGSDGATIEKL